MSRVLQFLAIFCALVLLPAGVLAAIWTDRLGDFERVSATPIGLGNEKLAEEYGFEQGEAAEYRFGSRSFRARAYQMADATGAVAIYQYLQPEGAEPAEFESLAVNEALDLFAVTANTTTIVSFQNYVLVFEGDLPTWDVLKAFLGFAPRLSRSTRPTLPTYLPQENLIPGSSRYILGPVSLDLFLPAIPSGVAAFSAGAEAQVATYQEGDSKLQLAIFAYPTPQLARKKLEEFEQLPNITVKRESSLIALCTNVVDRDFAERVLAQVRYRGIVTENERTVSEAERLRDLIINIIIMVSVLCGLALVAGLSTGGLRFLRRKASGGADDSFVHLGIDTNVEVDGDSSPRLENKN